MILPGERAASHRHTANALRLVLDAPSGVYTVVNGVRYDMSPNDIVLTPNWYWHGHANDGNAAAYWIDYLDVPLVRSLEPNFFEPSPVAFEEPKGTAQDRSLIYRWADTIARLATAKPAPGGCYGRQVTLDAYRFPGIGLHVCAFDAGARSSTLRTTANNVYTVIKGQGQSSIGGEKFSWERGDVFVAPAWQEHHHEPAEDTVFFRVTDEPLLAALGWLR
jgi:gentisate 1,2-dioxygenase